jgi:hypothetical protein
MGSLFAGRRLLRTALSGCDVSFVNSEKSRRSLAIVAVATPEALM